MLTPDPTDKSIILLTMGINILQQEIEKLEQAKQKKPAPFVTPRLDKTLIKTIIATLEQLSDQRGWKHHAKQGLVFWLEISDYDKAKEIASELKSMNVAKVTLTRRVDTKVPVIKCDDLNYQQLLNIARQNDDKQSANTANNANTKH